MQTMKQQWFGNTRADILSGMVVALALIPEAIAFSIIAGVSPMTGLYASFTIAIVISLFGGRPAMISAATGAMALVLAPLVRQYGIDYMLAATILTGLLQFLFGVCKISRLLKFIPNAVMIGFVNALAILVFIPQLRHIFGDDYVPYLFAGLTLLIVYTVPKFIKSIPAPLIAIVSLTAIVIFTGLDISTVGHMGQITKTLPSFLLPQVPFTWETLQIIAPYAFALAIVGLLESLMTASILDDMTDTTSDKNKEAKGQGIANIVTGFFGGMAGCAMIGQSVINVKSGGRGRLSTLVSGLFLLFLILVLGDLVVKIPMPVLAGIMVVVCIGTFDWGTFRYVAKAPRSDSLVMITTVVIVVMTDNLAIGVVAGVILSALLFAAKLSRITATKQGKRLLVQGPLFFASTTSFHKAMEQIADDTQEIDFSNSHLWDESAVAAVQKLEQKLEQQGKQVKIVGLNAASKAIYQQM
ncbi:SulP family inorganic anion transporter [Paenibacillus yanchengensis]|uniref:SulP family inorganic anion transporter n=1 Tax=Paenibacillus yanchengensis TaxID=2035833 RepID=A0ABW4YII7_9BACL